MKNVLIATGFNSQGIQGGVGHGAVLADLVVHGESRTIDEDMSFMDPRRFSNADVCGDATWCVERAQEGYADMYGLHHPNVEFSSGRGKVLSPVHEHLSERGAVFGPLVNGWERPQFFSSRKKTSSGHSNHPLHVPERLSYDASACEWYERARFEAHACRNGVAVFDMSSFGKLRVTGRDAARALDWCTSSVVPSEGSDSVQYTQCLNRRGGVECDITIVRDDGTITDEGGFYLVTPALTVLRDAEHILRESEREGSIVDVEIRDVTPDFAVLAVAGPESRELIADLLEGQQRQDVLDGSFAFGTARVLDFSSVVNDVSPDTLCLRVSYAGEWGVEIHASREDAPKIMCALRETSFGRRCNDGLGLVDGGYRALMQSLRVEKGFVHFGHDVSPTDTQLESSLGFVSAAKLKTDIPFLGREALEAQKQREGTKLRRRLVSFKVDNDASASLWGHEGVYRDGQRVGYVTSGGIGWAANEGRAIGLGFVHSEDVGVTKSFLRDGVFQVATHTTSGEMRMVDVSASLGCLYDPTSRKMRGLEI